MLMSSNGREARLYYLPGTFRVLSGGDYVRCALTGQPIPLDQLLYWSVPRQEAYATAQIAAEAERRA